MQLDHRLASSMPWCGKRAGEVGEPGQALTPSDLGSSVALNAILSAAILFMQISYLVPILLVCIRGDAAFAGHSRSWTLGRWRRPINIVALAFAVMTNVCFIFPPALPVTGESMNYAIVVFTIVMIMCGVTWVVDGRKHFQGPSDLDARLAMGKTA